MEPLTRREILSVPLVTSGPSDDVHKKLAELTTLVESLSKRIVELDEQQAKTNKRLAWLSISSPPVGTVMACAGEWPPKKSSVERWLESELGWLLCDGRKLEGTDYAALRLVLTAQVLPDYRGLFLRGIDCAIDGKTTTHRDKDGIRSAGSVQSCATALPVNPFVNARSGAHKHDTDPSHDKNGNFVCALRFHLDDNGNPDYDGTNKGSKNAVEGKNVGPDVSRARAIAPDGEHTHELSGGDTETRPANVAVHWIIKYK